MDVRWQELAQKYWLYADSARLDGGKLQSEIYTPIETASFSSSTLIALENTQIVERLLWPTYSDDASNQHVILLAALTNVKRQGNLSPWLVFLDTPDKYSSFFHRVLSLSLDRSLSISVRLILLEFVSGAFQSLEQEIVRKECARLVSISTWHNLHSEEYRQKEIGLVSSRQKAWKAAQKRFDTADKDVQVRLQFDRSWLFSMTLDFLQKLNVKQSVSSVDKTYCARYLEFLTDLISQLPTRRYTTVLLKDLNVLPIIKTSWLYQQRDSTLLKDLSKLYQHFSEFHLDDATSATSEQETRKQHYKNLAELQQIALKHFDSQLKVLALSNYGSLDKPGELTSHLSALKDLDLERLCQLLGFRTSYPKSSGIQSGRMLFIEVLTLAYTQSRDFRKAIRDLSVTPTEQSLYDPTFLQNETFDGSRPLAMPKLNLQYLSLDDFMWRSFHLYQVEAFYEIRKDLESIVRRLKPKRGRDLKSTMFEGFSKMALPIDKVAVIEMGQPSVGSNNPSFVRAEVVLDLSRLGDRVKSEWENLRPKDVVYLMNVLGTQTSSDDVGDTAEGAALLNGIRYIRTAEVVAMLDSNGKPLRDMQNGYGGRHTKRHLLIDLDPVAFKADKDHLAKTKTDVWADLNVICRRQGRENNFKPVLETIQRLVGIDADLPSWFRDVFLGYGNASAASYLHSEDRIDKVDFLDTFLDWQHLKDSFPQREVVNESGADTLAPPFVLQPFQALQDLASSNPKKRRRAQMEENSDFGPVLVSTYKSVNNGPYPVDVRKKNKIRFTPAQVNAIMSGIQPGLSLIVGPPGTGKTDVATQIINLLYHNFPTERILLVAHSNQALNQLFQKIIALDIDARHLLRLGHGEEELDTETSYSKHGRVESFMENRAGYLAEVNRLAASIGVQGAHGSSCETADYFNQVYIQPAWSKFWASSNDEMASTSTIASAFPFANFFSNAPVPDLFPADATLEEAKEIAHGCQRHLDKLFAELASIRPFEILRSPRDQANHLLVKEARIIAMTSTHAAMRRAEISGLGFKYDTLIMEEAAQITEVESFIPCAMQNPNPRTGELPLKRVVLVGDHLQNSPVVQNLALRQYANLEQSLFLRLVRLGVPTVHLDQQGRCRPAIASLFSWRYKGLTNLPHLEHSPEFARANAGFRNEYQFIDVPDYQGSGEREPTAHFIQNLGEAEYAVALYQYMRLLGYPARSISILTTYAGQKALIRDVLDHRCKGNKLFGLPKIVTTVDKYQGEQNDYIILSMVRTKSVGYLRDVRRLTVALSRARLGLYVLGRRELFDTCLETKNAIDRLCISANDKLELVTGEMFPTSRQLSDTPANVAEMDSVEHLGQYVFEMTQAKVKSMGGTIETMVTNGNDGEMDIDEAAEELADDVAIEEDPLHEIV